MQSKIIDPTYSPTAVALCYMVQVFLDKGIFPWPPTIQVDIEINGYLLCGSALPKTLSKHGNDKNVCTILVRLTECMDH